MRWRSVLQGVVVGITAAFAGSFAANAEDRPRAEIVPQLGHSGAVNSVAFAPDGRTALSGGGYIQNGELKLWDLASGHEIKKFVGHELPVNAVAIAPDGKTALSGGADGTVRLWDLASGREIKRLVGHSNQVFSV